PPDRWDADAFYDPDPDAPMKMYTRHGGFINAHVDEFDPEAFGISPREASTMDPQQRLLLELSWEALEDAGQVVSELAGSRTGVFVGINTSDYLQLISSNGVPDVDPYVATGNTFSVAAGRVSYVLGLQGPSLAVDTACSSSLVAVHLAVQSLRAGESSMVLAAGVNLMLSPTTSISMAKMRALSPDGRCKSFDAAADGYGRGEGCGVLVLKRLSQAQDDGDRIWALIRGSAVNQDGRSAGLTVPNGPAQQAVIRDALAASSLGAADVDYVEAHGTGTPLGDPIELQSLAAVLGDGRPPDRPLLVGSVKTNFGHLEAAAGVAGLIKVILALDRGEIPPHLHFRDPSPYVPWDELPIRVADQLIPWRAGDRPRIAGVSSFGFSGTNAHVLVQERPAPEDGTAGEVAPGPDEAHLLVLSARTSRALDALAREFQDFLSGATTGAPSWSEVCRTAARHRARHQHRLSIVARSSREASAGLATWLRHQAVPYLSAGEALGEQARKLIFVFSGQGGQWVGMGQGLMDREPVYREAIERCDALVQRHAGWSLVSQLDADEGRARLDDTEIAQPALFALQIALVSLWRSWGVVPDAVVGHSAGEVAAAYTAGALDLDDAIRVIVHRGRAMQAHKGKGKMAALGLSAEETMDALAPYRNRLWLAARNNARTTVVSGEPDAVDDLLAATQARQVFCRVLPGTYAFHSGQMAPCRAPMLDALADLAPRPPELPIFSTVTGRAGTDGDFSAAHWAANVTDAVRFLDAFHLAATGRHNLVVEVGPHPVLASAISRCLSDTERDGTVVGSIERGQEERATMLGALGALHVRGQPMDDRRVHPGDGPPLRLPCYRWDRQRCWFTPGSSADRSTTAGRGDRGGAHRDEEHPLLDRRFDAMKSGGDRYFESDLDASRLAYLHEHHVAGVPLLPVSAMVEMVLAAASRTEPEPRWALHDVAVRDPLVLWGADAPAAQVVLSRGDAGQMSFEVLGRAEERSDVPPALLATGRLVAHTEAPDTAPTLDDLRVRCPQEVSVAEVRAVCGRAGVAWGPIGDIVARFWRGDGQALAELRLPAEMSSDGYVLHPLVLETALQLHAAVAPAATAPTAFLPASISSVRLGDRTAPPVWAHVSIRSHGGRPHADVRLLDESGGVAADLTDVGYEPVDRSLVRRALGRRIGDLYYEIEWHGNQHRAPGAVPAHRGPPGSWLVLSDQDDLARRLGDQIEAIGHRCSVAFWGDRFDRLGRRRWEIERVGDEDQLRRLVDDVAGADGASLDGVVVLSRPAFGADHPAEAPAPWEAVLALAKILTGPDAPSGTRLWLVSRGAEPVDGEQPVRPGEALLWGLGRVIALEHPEVWGGLIDLSPAGAEDEATTLVGEMFASDGDDQVAYRGGSRYVARLVRSHGAIERPESLRLRGDASYLIAGGRGALGLKVALWMAEQGARHLILTGRRALPERSNWASVVPGSEDGKAASTITYLESLGVRVETPKADVADEGDMAAVVRSGAGGRPPLRGVVHAAGVFKPQTIREVAADDFRSVLRPKVEGTLVLHRVTYDLDLDFFVMFSSAASVWGSALAAHYVSANHFQDAFAHFRHRLGLPALSVNWGWWAGSDMVSAEAQAYFQALGLGVIPEDVGFAALEQLAASPLAQRTVAPVEWHKFKPVFEAKRRRPLFDLIEAGAPPAAGTASAEGLALIAELQEAPPARRYELAVGYLQRHVGEVLGLAPGVRMDPQLGFFEAGLDSMTSVDLKTRLEVALGIVMPATAAFEYPNIEAFAAYLVEDILSLAEPQAIPTGADESVEQEADTAELEGLSESELLALLAAELEEGRRR
ncbi:MAG: type I polyketide synthase, partial [Acidimicrobiales bacterium]